MHVTLMVWPAVWWMGGHGAARPYDPEAAARQFALLTAMLGLIVTVAGAAPVVFWLKQRGRLRLTTLLLAGLVLGNAPFGYYVIGLVLPATIVHLVMGTLSEHLAPISALIAGAARAVAIGSFFGVLSAATFWLVGVCRARR
jgi:hypothetical protein